MAVLHNRGLIEQVVVYSYQSPMLPLERIRQVNVLSLKENTGLRNRKKVNCNKENTEHNPMYV